MGHGDEVGLVVDVDSVDHGHGAFLVLLIEVELQGLISEDKDPKGKTDGDDDLRNAQDEDPKLFCGLKKHTIYQTVQS